MDFSAVLKISKVYSPILLIFKEDPDIVVPLVHQAASKKHVSIVNATRTTAVFESMLCMVFHHMAQILVGLNNDASTLSRNLIGKILIYSVLCHLETVVSNKIVIDYWLNTLVFPYQNL